MEADENHRRQFKRLLALVREVEQMLFSIKPFRRHEMQVLERAIGKDRREDVVWVYQDATHGGRRVKCPSCKATIHLAFADGTAGITVRRRADCHQDILVRDGEFRCCNNIWRIGPALDEHAAAS